MTSFNKKWIILLIALLTVSVTHTKAESIFSKEDKTSKVTTHRIKISMNIKSNIIINQLKHPCPTKKTCGTLLNYNNETAISKLKYIPKNLSGITYVADLDHYFLIQNRPARITEVDSNYRLIRTIKLKGFGDTEDLVYLGTENEFAIVNENSKMYIGKISADKTVIFSANFQEIIFDNYHGNKGAEGVTFDIQNQIFYIVKEAKPRKLYSFKRPLSNENMVINPEFPFDLQKIPHPKLTKDVSAVTYDPSTGRLLILSDKDRRLIDIDLNGTVFGILQLPGKAKYEGVTLDNQHRIHFVAEPNKFSIYSL